MRQKSIQSTLRARREREGGYILIIMGVAAVALFGALGMAVDIGRMFIVKNETQVFCDAGSMAAVLQLDGTENGISNAKNAVTNSTNKWNLDSSAISSPSVKFATAPSGPWVDNPSPATGYVYVKVGVATTLPLYFIPVVVGKTTQEIDSYAIAGQVGFSSGTGSPSNTSPNVNPVFKRGLAPYTVVSTNTTAPSFGLTVGTAYDIQWPNYNGTRAGCSPSSPDNCFVKSPCAGDAGGSAAEVAVTSNWGASISGYWGSSSNSDIEQEVMDAKQLGAISVGTNIGPAGLNVLTSGDKMAEAGYLDERVNGDINNSTNDLATYLGNPHNGRRFIAVPVVDPTDSTHTNVLGYAVMFLYANKDNGGGLSNYYKHNQNGNDPYCAIYAGCYLVGSPNPGQPAACGNTGAGSVAVTQ